MCVTPTMWEVVECECVDPTYGHIELGESFVFCDDFEDGNISDWTATTSGNGTIQPTNLVAQGDLWSLEMISLNYGDQAMGVTPAGVANQLDFTQPYTVEFDFRVAEDDYHFFDGLAVNKGPTAVEGQVLLVMDTPGLNDLIWRDMNGNHNIAFLNRNQWYHFPVTVRPGAAQYDVQVDGGAVDNVVNIPFPGAAGEAGFTGARVGDRNDESGGQFFDYGHAFWDNFCIRQSGPASCLGGCPSGYDCTELGVTYPDGTEDSWCECLPTATGACCFAGSLCAVMTQQGCAAQLGTFKGVGTTCDPNPCICRGDLNCDGVVSFGDINPFVLRLSNPQAYFAMFPGCPNENGDVNGNNAVGFDDINPFVALLSNNPLPMPCVY